MSVSNWQKQTADHFKIPSRTPVAFYWKAKLIIGNRKKDSRPIHTKRVYVRRRASRDGRKRA